MRVLGAILAGGRSRRFGSDKALAPYDGRPLIAHTQAALAAQSDALVVCGRSWGDLPMLEDRPAPALGPLGGLAAALVHGGAHGFDAVLSAPVDVVPLPADLIARLGTPPAAFAAQYAIGLWPVTLAGQLEAHLAGGARSIRSWIEASGCRLMDDADLALRNVNRPDDLPG